MTEAKAGVYVGVDWASESHQVCVVDREGNQLQQRSVKHSAAGLAELAAWLHGYEEGGPGSIWIGIEVASGSVVETLVEQGFAVFALNPKQLDRFRDRFTMAGAKDDRLDAYVLADSLRTDTHCFRRVAVAESHVIELREWSRMHEELQRERVKLANRLRQQLHRYYPHFLDLPGDVAEDWALAVWKKAPTPAEARRVQRGSVTKLLRKHRIRKVDAETVLATLRQPAITVAAGTTEAATAHVEMLRTRLLVVNEQLRQCRHHLRRLIAELATSEEQDTPMSNEQRDVTIALSCPGIGSIVLAALLAEAHEPLGRRDYHALRALAGVAPVTRRSGRRLAVSMRYACNHRLRNALYHWARVAVQKDARSRARYRALRERGHSHGRALRSVADRLLKVLCTLLARGETFDANYQAQEAA